MKVEIVKMGLWFFWIVFESDEGLQPMWRMKEKRGPFLTKQACEIDLENSPYVNLIGKE